MSTIALSGDFTISLWFNASAFVTETSEFITNPNNGMGGISLGVSNTGNNIFLGSPYVNKQTLATYSFQTNQWYHIVVSRESGSVSSWINNQNQNTSYNTSYDFTGSIALGWNNDLLGIDKSFIGKLDEIGIWDRKLNVQEISALYDNRLGLSYPFLPKPVPNLYGCTDSGCLNYNPNAIYDNGTCTYGPLSASSIIPLSYSGTVTSLAVSVGAFTLYPKFSANYYDYCIETGANEGVSNVAYSTLINGNTFTGTISTSHCLEINDGTSQYYVRFLPKTIKNGTAIPFPVTSFGPASGYVDGYYTACNGTFYAIYNKYGVPLWYTTYQPNVQSLELGKYANRVLTIGDNYYTMQINSKSLSATKRTMLPASDGAIHIIDKHQANEIDLPASRYGNISYTSYEAAFYIQEQTADASTVVWEFSGSKYFTNPDTEYYHVNAVDIHPQTGNYLVSCRHNSAIMCIEYDTKKIKWIMQGKSPALSYQTGSMPSPGVGGTLSAVALSAAIIDTKFLTFVNEPILSGYQYQGTCAQHHAAWNTDVAPLTAGNKIVTVLDNQTGIVATGLKVNFPNNAPQARAVLYEIDETNGIAYHRSSIFTGNGISTFKGNYFIFPEQDGTWTHQISFTAPLNPNVVEYKGEIDGPKTKIFSTQYAGSPYRVRKVRPSFFRLNNLRATCGMVIK